MDLTAVQDKTIVVLAGGQSSEREVSFRSGQGMLEALQRQGLRAIMVDPGRDLIAQLQAVGADVVVNALHGGAGENGTIQALLDWIGLPYSGSGVLASALTMNKVQTKRILAAVGIQSPPYVLFEGSFSPELVPQALTAVGLPAVTKPNNEGSSVGVTICRDEETLAAAMRECLEVHGDVLVDRYIVGTELTVGVLGCGTGARALPVLELVPKREFYDYEAKYTKGLTDLVCPARIPEGAAHAAQEIALVAHQTLGCRGISRTDMHLDAAGQLWFHEVNSCPGMTETSDVPHEAFAAGMTYDELVLEILQSAFEPR
ncbi:MAG: D-alanine--D-alanine ligase [Armatimonadetes bacterium]|nr:D-alanine--D-alanine ligase [Armatimonadota bacterium]